MPITIDYTPVAALGELAKQAGQATALTREWDANRQIKVLEMQEASDLRKLGIKIRADMEMAKFQQAGSLERVGLEQEGAMERLGFQAKTTQELQTQGHLDSLERLTLQETASYDRLNRELDSRLQLQTLGQESDMALLIAQLENRSQLQVMGDNAALIRLVEQLKFAEWQQLEADQSAKDRLGLSIDSNEMIAILRENGAINQLRERARYEAESMLRDLDRQLALQESSQYFQAQQTDIARQAQFKRDEIQAGYALQRIDYTQDLELQNAQILEDLQRNRQYEDYLQDYNLQSARYQSSLNNTLQVDQARTLIDLQVELDKYNFQQNLSLTEWKQEETELRQKVKQIRESDLSVKEQQYVIEQLYRERTYAAKSAVTPSPKLSSSFQDIVALQGVPAAKDWLINQQTQAGVDYEQDLVALEAARARPAQQVQKELGDLRSELTKLGIWRVGNNWFRNPYGDEAKAGQTDPVELNPLDPQIQQAEFLQQRLESLRGMAQQGAIPMPQTKGEYDELPSGSLYIFKDDGETYRKP